MNAEQIVIGVETGDEAAMLALWEKVRGYRFLIQKKLRGVVELDELQHNVYVNAVEWIRKGRMRNRYALNRVVQVLSERSVYNFFTASGRNRRDVLQGAPWELIDRCGYSPYRLANERQRWEIVAHALAGIEPQDREILIRFYLREQSPEHICKQMGLTETQFRLLKSRAKARAGKCARRTRAQGALLAKTLVA